MAFPVPPATRHVCTLRGETDLERSLHVQQIATYQGKTVRQKAGEDALASWVRFYELGSRSISFRKNKNKAVPEQAVEVYRVVRC
jgi:hypothetical protein